MFLIFPAEKQHPARRTKTTLPPGKKTSHAITRHTLHDTNMTSKFFTAANTFAPVNATNIQFLLDFSYKSEYRHAHTDTRKQTLYILMNMPAYLPPRNALLSRYTSKKLDGSEHLELLCEGKLSDYVQQQSVECHFAGSDSWVILSPIEQSIKRKIEAVGTPLKDWDIQINYGIKTGYNDAFIINTEKRDEILSYCQTEDERTRTAELIRPILRGRDIKRYGYNWAGLYLIATFPSRHYDIEKYPAVKKYLLGFGMERLEQTGKSYIVNGEKIKARKKTNNKWFETQDSISYWEDFFKPKVVYMEIQTDNPNDGYPFPCFSYDNRNSIALNTAYIMCSNSVDVRYVLGILNSTVGRMIARLYVTQLQERQYRMLAQYISKFPIAKSTSKIQDEVIKRVQKCLDSNSTLNEEDINRIVYQIYGFESSEIAHIENLI